MSKCLKISDCAETIEEARGVIDRMETRAREIDCANRRLRVALENIKGATHPTKLFSGSEASALAFIEKLAGDALANVKALPRPWPARGVRQHDA